MNLHPADSNVPLGAFGKAGGGRGGALVSVLIPVYNAGKHVRRCLESLEAQTFRDFEVVALDDGSTDGSLAVFRDFAASHPFLRVETQSNAGAAVTRNRLLAMAGGEFVMFMDDDDSIAPDFIARYVDEALRTGADVVCGGYRKTTPEGKVLFTVRTPDPAWSPLLVVTPWAKLYRRDFLLDAGIAFFDYPLGEDMPFCLGAYRHAKSMAVIDYAGYGWTSNPDSFSQTRQTTFSSDKDPVVLLDRCVAVTGTGGLFRYFYLRYVVWYLCFAGKTALPEDFLLLSGRLFAWLEAHGIPLRYPLFRHRLARGDIRIFISVVVFLALRRLGLEGVFARLYCRGRKAA